MKSLCLTITRHPLMPCNPKKARLLLETAESSCCEADAFHDPASVWKFGI